jgi:cell division protein FtsW (lipid II flippase)
MGRAIVADYKLLTAAGLLSLFGLAMVYSAGQTDTPTEVAFV